MLDERLRVQQKLIVTMFDKQKISPKTYEVKKFQLEKWVTKEKKNILKTKHELEKSWSVTLDTIKRTQRDLEFMKKVGEGIEKHRTHRNREDIPQPATDNTNQIKIIDDFQLEASNKKAAQKVTCSAAEDNQSFNIQFIDSDQSEDIDNQQISQIKEQLSSGQKQGLAKVKSKDDLAGDAQPRKARYYDLDNSNSQGNSNSQECAIEDAKAFMIDSNSSSDQEQINDIKEQLKKQIQFQAQGARVETAQDPLKANPTNTPQQLENEDKTAAEPQGRQPQQPAKSLTTHAQANEGSGGVLKLHQLISQG